MSGRCTDRSRLSWMVKKWLEGIQVLTDLSNVTLGHFECGEAWVHSAFVSITVDNASCYSTAHERTSTHTASNAR